MLSAVYAVPGALVILNDRPRGISLVLGVLPAAIVDLMPTRRERLTTVVLGTAIVDSDVHRCRPGRCARGRRCGDRRAWRRLRPDISELKSARINTASGIATVGAGLSQLEAVTTRPYVNGAYVNVPNAGMQDWATAYWGSNFDRLRRIKAKYDPDNVFQYEQSIPPASC